MKKWISLLLALILSLSLMAGGATAENAEESAEAAEAPVEDLVVLQHSAVVQGQTLHYTTTTGILPLASIDNKQLVDVAVTIPVILAPVDI